MKYAGYKKGMTVTLIFEDINGNIYDENEGIITYSSGTRLCVRDDQNDMWNFTRHGSCNEVNGGQWTRIEMSMK